MKIPVPKASIYWVVRYPNIGLLANDVGFIFYATFTGMSGSGIGIQRRV